MRQLILLLFIFAGYSVAQAQPFMVDTSYTDKHRPVHMKVYPNGKTIWISIKDSAGTSSYYANTLIQGSIQPTKNHIANTEYHTRIIPFDWEDKLLWLELTENADTLFLRWLACDENGQLVQSRRSSLAVPGLKYVSSGRFYNNRFLLVLEQFNTAGEARNLSLLEFDTLGQLVVNRPLTGLSTHFINNPNSKVYTPVTWLNDSCWLIHTIHIDTIAGSGQSVTSQKVTAFDYSANMRWSVDSLPYGARTSWKDENQLYLWAWGEGLRSYTRSVNGLQLNWGKSRADFGLTLFQMAYPHISTDANGITLVDRDSSHSIGIMRVDFQGNVLWYRKHMLWQVTPSTLPFSEYSYENWAKQVLRNSIGHFWLYGMQQVTNHNSGNVKLGLWYAYLDSNGCVNQQCTPLGVEKGEIQSAASLKVYPNPANDFIHVVLDNGPSIQATELRLHDMQGRLRLSQNINGKENALLDISALETGVYVLQLVQRENILSFVKVVVGR